MTTSVDGPDRAERILVVDDSTELREFLSQEILPQLGFETLAAATGGEALRLVAEQVPDVVLLDVQLPDISGLDVVEEMNRQHLQVPVILMTAHGSEAIAVDALRLGVQDYLVKPFDVEVVHAAIDRLLANARLEREKAALQQDLEQARRDLEQRVKELTVLFGISKSVTADLDLDSVLTRLVEAAVFITRAEEGALWLVEEGRDELRLRAGKGLAEGHASLERLNSRESFVGQMLQGRRPVRMAGTPADADLEIAAGYPVRALLSVSLAFRRQPVGVLVVMNRNYSRTFTPANEAMLCTLADYAAIAIENAQSYRATDQALSQRVEELTYLYDVARTLTSTLDREKVLDLVATRITEIFHVEAGALLLVDEEAEELEFATNWVQDPGSLKSVRLKLGQGIAGQVALTHQPAVTNDAYNDDRFYDQVDQATGFETRAILCVPLLSHDRCIGVIELLNKIEGPFTQEDLERLQNIASPVTVALENAQLYLQARELLKTNSRFVAAVARELCSPLTAIKGHDDMLLSGALGELEPMQAESVEKIASSTGYLIDLMEDMLDIASLEMGETSLDLQPSNLKDLVAQIGSSFEHRLAEKNMRLVVKIPARLPALYVDQKRIGQVLDSLVANAYLYTLPKGRISIEAQAENSRWLRRNTSEWVTVSVSDTGIGIATEDQPRVFERFFRADHPLVQQHPGRGLSLSIAHSLVELHEGRIWFESTPGQGTTFYFTLPSVAKK